jgi:hypothetical protein
VPDYPGYYADAGGRVFVLKELKPQFRRYAKVSMTVRGRTTWTHVHGMVCTAFHGRKPPGRQVAHENGDPWDNRASNLRWATPAENADDKKVHGRWGRRFTEEEIRAMKRRLADGAPGVDVAREFRTTSGFVSGVRTGKQWSHVQP